MSWGKYAGQVVRIEWRDEQPSDADFYKAIRVLDTKYRIAEVMPLADGIDELTPSGGAFPARWDEIERIWRPE